MKNIQKLLTLISFLIISTFVFISPLANAQQAEPEAQVFVFIVPDRCPPCQQFQPNIDKAIADGAPIKVINVDMNSGITSQYRVNSIPTVILVIAGREVDRIEGKPSLSEFNKMIERASLSNKISLDISKSVDNTKPDKNLQPVIKSKGEKPCAPESSPTPSARNQTKRNNGSTVRIRVKDSLGNNFGSGTIIKQNDDGTAHILTCGHIFRKIDDKSVIDVDVFNIDKNGEYSNKHETFTGKIIGFDLEGDVGMIIISSPTGNLQTIPLGDLKKKLDSGEKVSSIGCSGGDTPSILFHRVTAINRYLGPDNTEATGVPVQGRSGGGLFVKDKNGKDTLVGICIRADQRDQRGLYATNNSIEDFLKINKYDINDLRIPAKECPFIAPVSAPTPPAQLSPLPQRPFMPNLTPNAPPAAIIRPGKLNQPRTIIINRQTPAQISPY